MKTQTIFITCFFGLVARNILGTDVLKILKSQPNLKIVILGPQSKKTLLEQEFGASNVIVHGVPEEPLSFAERIAYPIFRDLLNTETRRIQRLVKFKNTKNFLNYILGIFLAFLGGYPLFVRSVRKFFNFIEPPASFLGFFEKYKPDLLFATDIMVPGDIRFMRAARRAHMPIAGMVRSWDNLTIYGILQVIPDTIVVQNEPIKDELFKYQFLSKDADIRIVGIPHYDIYVKEPRTPKGEFFRSLGLNPSKKTVMFTVGALKHWGDPELNIKIMETLSALNVNVLVRLPVMGDIDFGSFSPPANVILDKPPRTKESVDAMLNKEADHHLADSLFYSDVVVVGASTIMIDGAVFGKPAVYIDFDYNPMPYYRSATRLHDYNHMKTILESGGVRIAKKLVELKEAVQSYLANPNLDRAGRLALIRQKRFSLDGKSSERLTKVILDTLNQ